MLNVLDWLRKRSPTGRTAAKIYGSIVTQARNPAFYARYRVPDTPNGRYEMIVVHVFLSLAALRDSEADRSGSVSRALVEHFVTDMDDSLRQLAVGDLAVPKKVKRAAAGLRERSELYASALAAADPHDRLAQALATHVFGTDGESAGGAKRLAKYIASCRKSLAVAPDGQLNGFADPDAVHDLAKADPRAPGAVP
jgi:cytochrome b pre-mRNA-processing protein 3